MPLEFVHSRQGNLELLANNYIYSLMKHTIKKNYLSWKCIRCNVTIKTTSDKPSGEIIGDDNPKHRGHKVNLVDVKTHKGFSKAFREKKSKRIKILGTKRLMKIDPDNDENDNDDSSSSQTSESSKSAQIKTFTCKTVVGKVLKLNFQWKIENFEDCWWTYQPGSALESPKFSLRDDKKDEWYFQLFPRGTNKHRGNLIMYINLTIQPFHQLPKDFLAGGISMKINFGGIESPPTTSLLIEKCTENEFACVLDTKTTNYPRLFSTWCSKGTLLITADITGKTTTQKIYDEEFRTQDLEKWRGKNIFITFDVDGRQFKANRVHFEEASPVFYELINKQLSKKNTQNIITISDVKSKIFKQILDFINNSEEFTLNQSLVEDLLMAADLFELNKLKKICEKNICRNITIDNACRTLVLAHENKANKLKEEAIYLINANLQTIVYTSEYRNMAQYHPEVAEMLRKAKPLDHKIILLTNK